MSYVPAGASAAAEPSVPARRRAGEARLESVGCCLPSHLVSSEDLLAGTPVPGDVFEWATGIRGRRMCGPEPGNVPDGLALAVGAAQECLRTSRHGAADLDVVICTSIVRGQGNRLVLEPVTASAVAAELEASNALCFDIANACAGMVTGVLLLRSLIQSGQAQVGMVVSGEQFSLVSRTAAAEVTNLRDPQMASLTCGDSGVAVVLDGEGDASDRIDYVELMTASAHAGLCTGLPSERGPGLAMYASPAQLTDARLRTWPTFLRDFLAGRQETFTGQGFTHIIQHQVGVSVVDRLNARSAEVFQEEMPPSPTTVEEFGNTTSTALFFTLYSALTSGEVPPGSRVLMGVFASGMVFGFLSVTISGVRV